MYIMIVMYHFVFNYANLAIEAHALRCNLSRSSHSLVYDRLIINCDLMCIKIFVL